MKTLVIIKRRYQDFTATSAVSGYWGCGQTPEEALADLKITDQSIEEVELILN